MHSKATPGMTHSNRSINANHNYFMIYLQSCQLQMIRFSSTILKFYKIKENIILIFRYIGQI